MRGLRLVMGLEIERSCIFRYVGRWLLWSLDMEALCINHVSPFVRHPDIPGLRRQQRRRKPSNSRSCLQQQHFSLPTMCGRTKIYVDGDDLCKEFAVCTVNVNEYAQTLNRSTTTKVSK